MSTPYLLHIESVKEQIIVAKRYIKEYKNKKLIYRSKYMLLLAENALKYAKMQLNHAKVDQNAI
jgi:hypothetical protein